MEMHFMVNNPQIEIWQDNVAPRHQTDNNQSRNYKQTEKRKTSLLLHIQCQPYKAKSKIPCEDGTSLHPPPRLHHLANLNCRAWEKGIIHTEKIPKHLSHNYYFSFTFRYMNYDLYVINGLPSKLGTFFYCKQVFLFLCPWTHNWNLHFLENDLLSI